MSALPPFPRLFGAEGIQNTTDIDRVIGSITNTNLARARFFGPNFFSLPIDSALLAVIFCQLVSYHQISSEDGKVTRYLVYYVVATSCLSTAIDFVWCYNIFVSGFGRFHASTDTRFIFPFYLVFAFLIWGVQAHFTLKVFKLWKRSYVLAGICFFWAFVGLVGAIGMTVSLAMGTNLLLMPKSANLLLIFGILQIYGSAVADILITVLIIFGLRKSRTGWARTDGIIRKFIMLTFESQGPPTVFALVVGLEWAPKRDVILVVPYLILAEKLYTISLLFSLNSRSVFNRGTSRGTASQLDGERSNHFQLASRKGDDVRLGTVNVEIETYTQTTRSEPMASAARTTRHVLCEDELQLERVNSEHSTAKTQVASEHGSSASLIDGAGRHTRATE